MANAWAPVAEKDCSTGAQGGERGCSGEAKAPVAREHGARSTAACPQHGECCECVVCRLFSGSGLLSDPNMHPKFLGMLTAIGVNKAAYKPSAAEIKAKYYQKYRKSGEEADDEAPQPPKSPAKSDPKNAPTPSRKSPRLNAAA